MRVCAVNGTNSAPSTLAAPQAVVLLGQHDDRAALGRLVGEARELRGVGEVLHGDAGRRDELGGLAVAQGDRAGLVEQQRVHVAGRLDRAARHRQHVALHQPVHARDADRGQERADRRGDQTDQQRHQHDDGLLRLGVDREGLQRDGGEQEDDREARQQDVERDLVRRLLPLRALHQRDHPVDEGLARLRRDLHDDAVGQHLRSAGDGAAVAAGLADHRRGLARDRGLVDRRHALDDLAVAGDDLVRLHDAPVAGPQLGARHLLLGAVGAAAVGRASPAGRRAAWPPAPCRGPRPRPRPCSRTAR